MADIARYASFAAGARTNSTPERLRVASTAGILDRGDARTLAEAYELFWRLRLEHQVEQLRARRRAGRLPRPGDGQPAHAPVPARRLSRSARAAADARRQAAVAMIRLPLRRRSPAATAYRRAKPASASTPWKRARFVAVDLELTGLDPRRDEIISLATVPVEQGRVVVGASRSLLVRPQRMPGAETIRVHKLRPARARRCATAERGQRLDSRAAQREDRRRPPGLGRARVPGSGASRSTGAAPGAGDLHRDARPQRPRRAGRRARPRARARGGRRSLRPARGSAAHGRRGRAHRCSAVHRAGHEARSPATADGGLARPAGVTATIGAGCRPGSGRRPGSPG